MSPAEGVPDSMLEETVPQHMDANSVEHTTYSAAGTEYAVAPCIPAAAAVTDASTPAGRADRSPLVESNVSPNRRPPP